MTEQKKEIETIKPREYSLKLSDADVLRIAKTAGAYDMTVSELLENFIGDLVNGTYTNGSDERMCAKQWAERCWFSHDPDKSLVKYLCDGMEYEFSDLRDALERIEGAKEDIRVTEKSLAEPGDEWKELYYHKYNDADRTSYECVPSYNSVEEYIASETEALESYKEDLEEALEALEDIKNSFQSYMDDPYEWDEEVKKAEEWYKENIAKKLGD